MKHFIWMLCGIFLSGLLLGSLSACGDGQDVSVTAGPSSQETEERDGAEAGVMPEEDVKPGDPAAPEEASPGEAVPEEESVLEEEAAPASKDDSRRLAYAKVLEDALFNGVLPDGTKLDWTSAEEAAKNQFAVCDLDGDGEEELLLRWTNAVTAGTLDVVFGYDGGAVRQELSEFAGVVFYAGGTAEAGWSHSQGWAGRFWPYNLYQYSRETGDYVQVGAVDAWDLSLTSSDETLANAFPKDVDTDGDGLVYYILTGEWYLRDRISPDGTLYQLWGADPVDGAEMEAWRDSYTGGAGIVQLPLQKLTAENISDLGYWSIPGPAQEAAG